MNQYSDNSGEEFLAEIGKVADRLAGHCDSVLILCTGPTADGTGSTTLFKQQRGNIHAHEGAVREFLREQEAYQNAYFAVKGTADGRNALKDEP